jgi:hypothetical protein
LESVVIARGDVAFDEPPRDKRPLGDAKIGGLQYGAQYALRGIRVASVNGRCGA